MKFRNTELPKICQIKINMVVIRYYLIYLHKLPILLILSEYFKKFAIN